MNIARTGVRSVWKRSWTFLGVKLQHFGSESVSVNEKLLTQHISGVRSSCLSIDLSMDMSIDLSMDMSINLSTSDFRKKATELRLCGHARSSAHSV